MAERPTEWSGEAYAASATHHRTMDEWFLGRDRPAATDVVVDLGCGSGEFTARLADIAVDGRVIGVEPDPSMLDVARHHVRPNLTFLRGSAQHVGDLIEPASADMVVSRAALHWLPIDDYPKVFAGAFRVLRPGGRLHTESGGAGNVYAVTDLLEEVGARFGLPRLEPFPDAGVVFDLVEAAGFEMPTDGVRTVAQRRPFTREALVSFLRAQAAVALTRSAPADMAEAIIAAVVAGSERLRRADGSYDQTFVRLEIRVRKPEA